MLDHRFWFYWVVFCGLILVRYVLIAGGTHYFFYSALGQSFSKRAWRLPSPSWRSMRHDIDLSARSAVVFALCAALIMTAYDAGKTSLYTDLHQYGWWYLGVSYAAVLMLQDTYFYFTHCLCHQPLLFKWLHQGHHRSRQPTAWTSFAFDPLEAVVQAVFLGAIVFIVPLHFITLIAILITMTVWAVVNHLGLDVFPVSFPHHWLGRWFIGPAHHSVHHRRYTLHYGLYFTFWDKLLGTHDPNYEKTLNASLKPEHSGNR